MAPPAPVLDFDALYREHWEYIVSVCRTHAAENDEAEDLAQSTFLRAFRFRESFRGDASPRTWLHRIAINVCCANASRTTRARWRKQLVSFDELSGGNDGNPGEEDWQPPVEATQQREVEERETGVRLAQLIRRLTSNVRVVIELRYCEGKTIEETQQILGLTESAVKARSHRGVLRLREGLACMSTR